MLCYDTTLAAIRNFSSTPLSRFSAIAGTGTSSARISAVELFQPKKTSTTSFSPLINAYLTNPIRSINVSAPKYSAASGTHSTLWTVERALAAGLLAILPAAIIWPSQPLDALLAVSIVMHAHWGLEAIVVDYVRAVLFGNFIPKLAHGLLILFSAATLAGLFYFIYNDIGLGRAVRKIWAVKSD